MLVTKPNKGLQVTEVKVKSVGNTILSLPPGMNSLNGYNWKRRVAISPTTDLVVLMLMKVILAGVDDTPWKPVVIESTTFELVFIV